MNLFKLFLLVSIFIFVLSCQNNHAETQESALSDSTSYAGMSGNEVKLVKTAALRTKVKDVESSTKAISELAAKYQGMVYHQTFTSEEDNRRELKISDDSLMVISLLTPTANITARVPSEDLQNFLYDVAAIGYLTERNSIDIQDKSLQFLHNKLKRNNRNQIRTKTTQSAKLDNGDLNAILQKDEAINQQIANLAIDAEVRYSSVEISLFQNQIVKREVIPNNNLSAYNLPFGNRISNATKDGLDLFLTFLVGIAHFWVFILFAVIIYWSYHWYKKKMVS